MNLVEQSQRARVVEIARSWKGTKYHHSARIKGVGVDCATIIQAVFEEAGLIPAVDLPAYSPQWHLHRDEEKYLEFIRRFAADVAGPPERAPQPGDVIVWRFHRAFAHGGIVTAWPLVVHAFIGSGVNEDDALATAWLATVSERTEEQGQPRARVFLSWWAKPRA